MKNWTGCSTGETDYFWRHVPVIIIPTPIRSYVNGNSRVRVKGKDAGEALKDLVTQFPALKPHLTRADGKPRAFVNVFIGENNIRDLKGWKTPIGETEELRLVFSIAGG
jgi:adenylyltransferase/sulfurtransferase